MMLTDKRTWPKYASWKSLLLLLLLSGVALNGIAWMQAYAMTHYSTDAITKTAKPETLSPLEKAWVIFTGVRVPRPNNNKTPDTVDLAYETHIINFDSANGETSEHMEAWHIPAAAQSKGLVLLFPPYAASKQALLGPGQLFHHLGYDILLVDFRGVGGSSGSETSMGVREGADVAQAMRYAKAVWPDRPMVLYGASLGAVAVMRAIAHENVTPVAAIVESPFDNLLGTVRHRFRASGIPSLPSAELLVFWGSLQQDIDGFAHNPADYAKKMDLPVLLLHGEADTRVRTEDAEAIFSSLPNRKELVLFPTVGHGAFAKDDPTKWIQTVQQFLEQS